MKTIILMLDALGDAPAEAVNAAERQGYDFRRFIQTPRPEKQTEHFERIRDITISRNKSRQWILEEDFDKIALVDSDVVMPEGAVDTMLSCGTDLVGGWVPVRGTNGTRWIAGKIKDNKFANFEEPNKESCETDMIPLACCVMPRKIFETIEVRAPAPRDRVTCAKTLQPMIPSEPFLYSFDLKTKFDVKCLMHPDVICQHLT